jgi:hypothetical protein
MSLSRASSRPLWSVVVGFIGVHRHCNTPFNCVRCWVTNQVPYGVYACHYLTRSIDWSESIESTPQYGLTLFLVTRRRVRICMSHVTSRSFFVFAVLFFSSPRRLCRCVYRPLSFLLLRPLTWTNHPVLRFFTMGNQQSTFSYEPTKFSTSTTSTAKPVKSAMRRTSSVSEDAAGLGQGSTMRYLPKGLGAGHSGLLIPTRPGEVATTGYHSPEWGW